MKKAVVSTGMLMLMLIVLLGCSPEAVVIPDAAFILGFDRYGEASLSKEFPDLEALISQGGFRTTSFSLDLTAGSWEPELLRQSARFFVWAPLRGSEAVRFHQNHPETAGLWLSLGMNRLTDLAPENLAVLVPRREYAWNQLNSILIKEGYRRVAGVFSSSAAAEAGIEDVILPNLEWFYSLDSSEGSDAALEFLKNHVSGEADFIILAAGEANPRLYQELRHWQVPLFIEAPFPGAESDPSVKGLFVSDWSEGLKKFFREKVGVAGGLYSFNSRLWWRHEKGLQPRE